MVEGPEVYCPKEGRKVPVLFTLSETDKAYFAGSVDADGTICFSTQTRTRNKLKKPRLEISPVVGIFSSHKTFINHIENSLGFGHVTSHPTGYYWKATSIDDVLKMCEIIESYLKLKQRQCKLMIEYCELRLSTKNEWHKPWYKPYKERELWILEKVTSLNRGKLNG